MSETPEAFEPVPETGDADTLPPLDLSALTADDTATITGDGHGIPDHTASRERRRLRRAAGDKADDAPRRKPRKPAPRPKRGQFTEPLTQMYVGVGGMLMPFDPVCANAVIQSAEQCAQSLDDLAYQNDAVRRALVGLTQTSAVGVVLIAHMPIILAVMVHHVPAAQRVLGGMGERMAEDIAAQMGTPDGEGQA